jgi:hypothetical protein
MTSNPSEPRFTFTSQFRVVAEGPFKAYAVTFEYEGELWETIIKVPWSTIATLEAYCGTGDFHVDLMDEVVAKWGGHEMRKILWLNRTRPPATIDLVFPHSVSATRSLLEELKLVTGAFDGPLPIFRTETI